MRESGRARVPTVARIRDTGHRAGDARSPDERGNAAHGRAPAARYPAPTRFASILRRKRKTALDALFPRSRSGILRVLLAGPDAAVHLSEIARRLGVPPSSLQGNRVAYAPNEACPFLAELRGLVQKTVGVADVLRGALAPLATRIPVAFVFE